MKCVDCQFNLLCHAGRLDSWSKEQQSIVLLCPRCNRLCVGHHETLRIFKCEQRQLGPAALAHVAMEIAKRGVTPLSAAQVPDMGPGLVGKLTIAYCAACIDTLPPQMRKIKIEYLDENRTETLEQRMAEQRAEAIEAEEDDCG